MPITTIARTADQSSPPPGPGSGSPAGRNNSRYGWSRSSDNCPARSPCSSWQRPGADLMAASVSANLRAMSRCWIFLLAASVAKELVDRRQEEFGTVARFSRPWSCLVGCGWSECGHKDQSESDLWVKGRGDLSEWAAVSYQHIEGRRRTAPVRADTSELGLRNQPPDYVVPLLGQDATAQPTGAGANLRLPPRVGALTIFRPAG
jgi:hypothetical protein